MIVEHGNEFLKPVNYQDGAFSPIVTKFKIGALF